MKSEEKLYPDIESWLNNYLKENYPTYSVETTHDSSRKTLDVVLKEHGIKLDEAVGLSIKIDVIGILKKGDEIKLVFVEVKDEQLTLKDLGQLWGYTQLIQPVESFLISSENLGSLQTLLRVHKRIDLLRYGEKGEKYMKVAIWDERAKAIDYSTLLPKI